MKIAIIHDCLTVMGGAERVLQEILTLFPEADLFSIVDFLPPQTLLKRAKTSFIQKCPFAKKIYRYYLPLMPYAIENFDLSSYNLIISSSYAVAKGVMTGPDQLHLCYCHSPMRYVWDLHHSFLKEMGLKGLMAKRFYHKLRLWDVVSSQRVDYFIANSAFIKERIEKVYRRDSFVIYPPVDVERFSSHHEKKDFYLTCSRLVSYKRVDLIVETFGKMPEKKLVIIGDGPEYEKIFYQIKKGDFKNISLMRSVKDEKVAEYMGQAKGFVFAAKEDFGIVCVEAQSAGTGVIAFGEGGSLETVKGLDDPNPTGCFFYEQSVESLMTALNQYEQNIEYIKEKNCRENALKFSKDRFRREFFSYIKDKVMNHEGYSFSRRQRGAPLAHITNKLS